MGRRGFVDYVSIPVVFGETSTGHDQRHIVRTRRPNCSSKQISLCNFRSRSRFSFSRLFVAGLFVIGLCSRSKNGPFRSVVANVAACGKLHKDKLGSTIYEMRKTRHIYISNIQLFTLRRSSIPFDKFEQPVQQITIFLFDLAVLPTPNISLKDGSKHTRDSFTPKYHSHDPGGKHVNKAPER